MWRTIVLEQPIGEHMKTMKIHSVVMGLACCILSNAYAEDRLPSDFTGSGTVSTGRTTVTRWSIVIDSQEPDGTIKGKMNWSGRVCFAKDLPFTGSYRDGTLEFSAPETDPKCGAWTAKLKRMSPNEYSFEGALSTTVGGTAAVTLKPL